MAGKNRDNRWYVNNESNTVFIFIHGFFSNSTDCWTSASGIFWPDLIREDRRLNDPSIFMASYYTDIDSGDYKVSDCAEEILSELQRPGFNGEKAVLEKPNIIFICHSLGGIVVRYMIERSREKFINKALGLVLIASPSYGSDYATKLSKLIKFYKNRIAAQLTNANGSLQDLDDRFRSLVQNQTIPKLRGTEAVEHHFILHWKYLPGFAPVVNKESASRYFGAGKILPGTNHSTCVKPDSYNHVSHKFLASFYINSFNPIAHPLNVPINKSIHIKNNKPDPLFEIYNLIDEPFYFKREIDTKFSDKVETFSVWLHGKSGMGKTACTRRRIFQGDEEPVQVYIGALTDIEINNFALLNEIYYTICGITEQEVERLDSARKLAEKIGIMLSNKCSKSGIVLVIDEIPLMNDAKNEIPMFLHSIINIISTIKRQSGISRACIILNSIFDPTEYIDDREKKIDEQIKFLSCDEWQPDEILGLAHIISSSLDIEINKEDEHRLVEKSVGSPRSVKTHFKDNFPKNKP